MIEEVGREEGLIESGAIACVPQGSKGMLELESAEGRFVPQVTEVGPDPRDDLQVAPLQIGSGKDVVENAIGPGRAQPKILRTREGDFPLQVIHGGAISDCPAEEGRDTLGLGCNGPVLSRPCQPVIGVGGNLPTHLHCSRNSDRCHRNKSKKVTRRANPYLPCNKLLRYHEATYRKGGGANKKKSGKKVTHNGVVVESSESDPILVSSSEVRLRSHLDASDLEGIGLEVVLSRNSDGQNNSSGSFVPCSVAGRGDVVNSGLNELLGVAPLESVVDKDRGDAFHIIDIQEDIGMKFNGEGEEDVVRCMELEVRDREVKMAQVHVNSYQ
ncbi:hypothetical protein P8452_69049 [Trifolium repens]|nr:hypothetical protein P8452_69049 [Trifolium repens]